MDLEHRDSRIIYPRLRLPLTENELGLINSRIVEFFGRRVSDSYAII